jgi:pyridoxine kinase
MIKQKRVAAIHDISCFGKCSLTVALPIISAAGIEVSVIPTAVLSTHTGGFTDFTFRDLTDDILPVVNHWESLGLRFDAIYTGYLGSFRQLEIISEVFERLGSSDTLKLVDPVMADNGVLYKSFPDTFPAGMRKLCEKADVIIPNITEAAFMLGMPYQEGPYTKAYIEDLLKKLGEIGPKQVVLTGVHFDDKQLGAATYDIASGHIGYSFADRVEGYYHGTGDVFGSALLAALLRGFDLERAADTAVGFTVGSIARTKNAGTDIRFGVDFESGLGKLAQQLADTER